MADTNKLYSMVNDLYNWTEVLKIVAEHDNGEIPTEDSGHIYVLAVHLHSLADKLLFEILENSTN